MTTRALSGVKNEKMKRSAEAHLLKLAGGQHSANGDFARWLTLFSSYDHPVSKVVIMRSIPWIVNNQNEDDSWGSNRPKID